MDPITLKEQQRVPGRFSQQLLMKTEIVWKFNSPSEFDKGALIFRQAQLHRAKRRKEKPVPRFFGKGLFCPIFKTVYLC